MLAHPRHLGPKGKAQSRWAPAEIATVIESHRDTVALESAKKLLRSTKPFRQSQQKSREHLRLVEQGKAMSGKVKGKGKDGFEPAGSVQDQRTEVWRVAALLVR